MAILDTVSQAVIATVPVGDVPVAWGQFVGLDPAVHGDIDTPMREIGVLVPLCGANSPYEKRQNDRMLPMDEVMPSARYMQTSSKAMSLDWRTTVLGYTQDLW